MTNRYVPGVLVVTALVTAAVVVVVFVGAGEEPTEDQPITETILTGTADDAGEALSFARDILLGCPPICRHNIESMKYVEVTAGDAKANLPGDLSPRFDPATEMASWPDDLTMWVIVAEGEFQQFGIGDPGPQPVFGSLWTIVPRRQAGLFWFETNARYNLGQLGDVGEVDLPLPRWPTPVTLRP